MAFPSPERTLSETERKRPKRRSHAASPRLALAILIAEFSRSQRPQRCTRPFLFPFPLSFGSHRCNRAPFRVSRIVCTRRVVSFRADHPRIRGIARDSWRKVRDAFHSIASVDDSSCLRSARKLVARIYLARESSLEQVCLHLTRASRRPTIGRSAIPALDVYTSANIELSRSLDRSSRSLDDDNSESGIAPRGQPRRGLRKSLISRKRRYPGSSFAASGTNDISNDILVCRVSRRARARAPHDCTIMTTTPRR